MSRPGQVLGQLAYLPEALADALLAQVAQVQQHAALHAPSFVDLRLLGAGHHVAGGQLHLLGGVAGHEPFAQRVQQVGPLAASALGEEDAAILEGRRVELDELHVHQRRAGAIGQAHAIAGGDEGVGGRLVDATQAAGGQDHRLRGDSLELAAAHLHGDDAAAGAVLHHQRGDEPLLVGGDAGLDQLLPHHVQDGLAGDVAHVAGAGKAGAAEGPLLQTTVLAAAEHGAHVLQLDDVGRSLLAQHLGGVLVGQVVAALDGIEGVRLPRVLVAQGGIDPSLGSGGVAAQGVDLGQHGHIDRFAGGLQGRPHSRQASAYHQHVMRERDDLTPYSSLPTEPILVQLLRLCGIPPSNCW